MSPVFDPGLSASSLLSPAGHQELLTSEAGLEVYGATPSSDAKENTTPEGSTGVVSG